MELMRTLRIGLGYTVLVAITAGAAWGRGPDEDVDKLIAQIKDPKTQGFAKRGLAEQVGRTAGASKKAVPALLELLKDPENAQYAAAGLGVVGPAAKEGVPAM